MVLEIILEMADLNENRYPGFALLLIMDFNFNTTKVTKTEDGVTVEAGDEEEGDLVTELVTSGFEPVSLGKRITLVKNRDIDLAFTKEAGTRVRKTYARNFNFIINFKINIINLFLIHTITRTYKLY